MNTETYPISFHFAYKWLHFQFWLNLYLIRRSFLWNWKYVPLRTPVFILSLYSWLQPDVRRKLYKLWLCQWSKRLLTCLLTYLFTYLLNYLLTHLLSYFLTYLLTHLLTYLHTYSLTYLLTYLFTYLLTHSLTYLLTYILTYLLTCLFTYLLTN